MIEQRLPQSPYDQYGPEFLEAVQSLRDSEGNIVDGMEFVRQEPLQPPEQISAGIRALDLTSPEEVKDFLGRAFSPRRTFASRFQKAPRSIDEHGEHLLTDALVFHNPEAKAPYIALNHPHPAADLERFQDIDFGWDDDEVVDGWLMMAERALQSGDPEQAKKADRWIELTEATLQNKADLIDLLGYVPNGNIACLATRAQPPMFPDMLDMYVRFRERNGLETPVESHPFVRYLPQVMKELAWWDRGKAELQKNPNAQASEHVILARDDNNKPIGYLYRYWDARTTPREESYREDVELATMVLRYDPSAQVTELFRNIRASAESGWDFSYSRQNKHWEQPWTNEATHRAEPDLCALLYLNKQIAAQGWLLKSTLETSKPDRKQQVAQANQLKQEAQELKDTANKVLFNKETGLYHGYDFKRREHTAAQTLASFFPLYAGMTTHKIERQLVDREADFRLPGGWATSLHRGLEGQWEGDVEWIILERKMQKGLERIGQDDIAARGRGRVVAGRSKVYGETGKIPEKVDGRSVSAVQRGEYELFGDLGMSVGALMAMRSEVHLELQKKPQNSGARLGAAVLLGALAYDVVR